MMNCTEFTTNLDDYCSGELDIEVKASCDQHLAECTTCSGRVAEQASFLASLKAMPVAGPSEGFADRALRAAVDQSKDNQHKQGFLVGFGSAAVAALALWVVVGVNPIPEQMNGKTSEVAKSEAGKAIPEFSIALNEQRDIKLAFHSSEDLKGAQITVQMPENVALVGFPGQRELAWKTNLAKGDNLLRLPVVATGAAGGQLVAHIEYMGKVKTLKVNFAVSESGVSSSTGTELNFV